MVGKKPEDIFIIIFGATGDLTKRELIPALFYLFSKNQITKKTRIIGVARKPFSKTEFIKHLSLNEFIPNADEKNLKNFTEILDYFSMDFTNPNIKELRAYINRYQEKLGVNNKIFYLAISPALFKVVVEIIQSSNLLDGRGWKRVIIEKPFGHNLVSARELNKYISSVFDEKDIYRIDHFLAKELVENIMVFRFANTIFEQIWYNKFVDNIQITVAETLGVELRAGYYDKAGAIRDMVQNHILQILSLVAMESPNSMDPDDIRDQKVKVFRAIQKVKPEDVVVGQYTQGSIQGKKVVGYREEPGILKNSKTETYAAIKFIINNYRWRGVPFYIRTGKKLNKKHAEVNVVLKDVACDLFCLNKKTPSQNVITLRIQPYEGISIKFNTKLPGHGMTLYPTTMDFCHKCKFGINTPEAYEHLLYDVIIGDKTLFTRWDGNEASWKIIDPIIKNLKSPELYPIGSEGPIAAEKMLKKDGKKWIIASNVLEEHKLIEIEEK